MTDDNTTAEAPDVDEAQAPENPNAEAAKYRHRAKEAEAERDALAEKVTALRRAAVDDRVKAHKVPVDGFWASGVTLEELLDEDGNLDDEKVKVAADQAVEKLGLERIGARGPYVSKEGNVTSPRATPSWEAAFGPK